MAALGFKTLLVCLVILALVLVGPFVIMVAWNLFVPWLLGGPTIGLVEAVLIWLVLSVIGSAFRR